MKTLAEYIEEAKRRDPVFSKWWGEREAGRALAVNVIRLRLRRGWTQAELAERAGMHQPNISKVEGACANPKLRTVARIAKALDTTVSALTRTPTESAVPNEETP